MVKYWDLKRNGMDNMTSKIWLKQQGKYKVYLQKSKRIPLWWNLVVEWE